MEVASEIAERCTTTIELGKIYLPQYDVPEGEDLASFLRKTSTDGLNARLAELDARQEPYDRKQYEDRLSIELDIIIKWISWLLSNRLGLHSGREKYGSTSWTWARLRCRFPRGV